jgi:hypothetical protein
MAEASEEGKDPCRAVKPMMIVVMMMIYIENMRKNMKYPCYNS